MTGVAVPRAVRDHRPVSVWAHCGAHPDDHAALAAYAAPAFGRWQPDALPMADEAHVATWAAWVAAARERGAADVLREQLPQLRFAIADETQQSEAWMAATRRGVWPRATHDGPSFAAPEGITLELVASAAGQVPVITAAARSDFEYLQRALCARCAPVPIPPSSGAIMVAGFVNWSRVHATRQRWAAARGRDDAQAWAAEFARIKADVSQWQDRFILLSAGPYAAVPASHLGLSDAAWRAQSLIIRREHEMAHYVTKRFFGVMRNALHDELLADYSGVVAATGQYPAPWGRRLLGIDESGALLPGGRLWNYRGTPALSDRAMRALATVASYAIDALAAMDQQRLAVLPRLGELRARTAALLAIAHTPVADMSSVQGSATLRAAFIAAVDALEIAA